MQSLADVAREEAERRRLLEQQGIEGKVFDGDAAQLAPNGNLTISTTPSALPKKERIASPKGQTSARSYRTALQKRDRAIRQAEERLESRRARLQAGRWALPSGRASGRNRTTDTESRLQEEIEDLQAKLKELRQERAEIYEEGRKAGFLPGELDGKGIVP